MCLRSNYGGMGRGRSKNTETQHSGKCSTANIGLLGVNRIYMPEVGCNRVGVVTCTDQQKMKPYHKLQTLHHTVHVCISNQTLTHHVNFNFFYFFLHCWYGVQSVRQMMHANGRAASPLSF